MCGRFVIARERDDLIDFFDVDVDNLQGFEKSYNVAPTQTIPIVVEREVDGLPSRELHSARWGLLPSFAKDLSGQALINARIETALEKPSFREATLAKRCIIPASGYFEWRQDEKKQPFYIHPPEGMLAFAGIYWWWRDPSKDQSDPSRWLLTASTFTKDSAPELSHIHDRNPVMLSPDSLSAWLAPDYQTTPEVLSAIGRESDAVARELLFNEVSPAVGSVRNNSEEVIRPI